MTALEIILMIVLLILGIFLVVSMLLQKGENKLSSSIAGGAETYYGKEQSARSGKLLSLLTNIAGIAFVVLVLVVYIIQPNYGTSVKPDNWESISSYFASFAD